MSEHIDIMKQLNSSEPSEIREAAFAAGQAKMTEAIPLLAGHIRSSNLGVQEAADRALRQIGGDAVVQAVVPLLRSDDAPLRNISMDILREVGAHDLQTLIDLLHDDDPDIRIFMSDILGTSDNRIAVAPLCEALLKDPEVNVRYQAAVSLGTLGFVDAADCLNKAMKDEEWVQFSVIEALSKIGADSSVNALARALDTSSDLVGSMIVEALGEMGNIKAVSVLMKRLDSSPSPLRNKIVKAIVQILGGKSLNLLVDKERDKFRQYLLAALEDEDEDIQDAAVLGLGYVGGEKASAELLRLASTLDPDRDHERLLAFVQSIASIGFNPALENVVRSGDEFSVRIAVEAILHMEDKAAVQLLMDEFWNKSRDEQRAIIHALAEKADEGAKDFFLDVLERHRDGNVLKAALYFLGERIRSVESGDQLFAMLEHPYDDVKEAALEACIALEDPGMVERFRFYHNSPDPIQRMMAVYALGKLGVDENLEILTAALEDEVPDIRKIALESLFQGCLCDFDRLALVVPRLHDENREVRLALVDLIGGCTSEGVEPYLIEALQDTDDWVIVRAIEAFGKRRSKSGVPNLIELLESTSPLVRLKAIEALGEIGGKAAFRSLLALMDSGDQELQEAAQEAAEKIRQNEGEGE